MEGGSCGGGRKREKGKGFRESGDSKEMKCFKAKNVILNKFYSL